MRAQKFASQAMWAVAAVLALAGCGSAVDRKPPRPNSRQAAEHALRLWSRYPVGSSRPVLLIEGSVLAPNGGFGTIGAKLAFLQGRFMLRTALPPTPLRFRGWQVSSARQALDVWRSQSSRGRTSAKERLVIIGVRLASASFSTETGSRTLPAWVFAVRGLDMPVQVLALPASRVFNPPTSWDDENATVSDDGRVVHVAFVGGHAGDKPCDDSYTAGSVENTHAVAFWIVDHAVGGGSQICDAVGYPRIVSLQLDKPLGTRALVNSYGAPVPVCRTNTPPVIVGIETCIRHRQ
jgi:hypothetical protein